MENPEVAIELCRITEDERPLRRALVMARAIETYIQMLTQDDDAGEEGAPPQAFADALEASVQLTETLRRCNLTL